MKKQMISLFIFSFLLMAFIFPSVPEDEHTTLILSTNTIVPTPAISPSPTPESQIFRDDFNDSIDKSWKWLKESKKYWSITNKPGWLEIIAGKGSVFSRNLLFRPIPEGNFELETKLIFEPVTNYQFAGLAIYYNNVNYILFGRAFCDRPNVCAFDGFYMDMNLKGKLTGGNFATPAPATDTVFLRLRREGDSYTSYSSEDGSHWIKIGTHTSTMKPKSVGLAAGQSMSASLPAQFDYFVINKIP
jgi:beta-xylosidase